MTKRMRKVQPAGAIPGDDLLAETSNQISMSVECAPASPAMSLKEIKREGNKARDRAKMMEEQNDRDRV